MQEELEATPRGSLLSWTADELNFAELMDDDSEEEEEEKEAEE